jgi:hypothetical protein
MIPPHPVTDSHCLLVASATQLPEVLELRYELTNTSATPLYLFNKLARLGGASVFDTDPNAANIVLHPDHVTIGKTLVPVPSGKEIERPYVPCLNLLAPGAKLTETMRLPSPLAPFTWYASRPMRSTPVSRAVVFELGYALASPEAGQAIRLIDTPYGSTYAASWFPPELQHVISSAPLLETLVFSAR